MWLEQKQVSFYRCPADNTGEAATLRQVLLSRVAIEHEWYYKDYSADKQKYPKGKWNNGVSNDLNTIIKLSSGPLETSEKTTLKQTMQCFTPAALLKTKKQGGIEEISRTGILQLDFDYNDIKEYDVEELKQCVFSLPFIAFCSLSCSQKGFYALALIAEPDKLKEYAEHCFNVLLDYGIKADTTKGRNVNDLRFLSYDENILIRENPEPLQIKHFRKKHQPRNVMTATTHQNFYNKDSKIVRNGLKSISEAQPGQRWQTVQKVSYTLGGLGDSNILFDINSCINSNPSFTGEETKYIECATICFNEGMTRPIYSDT